MLPEFGLIDVTVTVAGGGLPPAPQSVGFRTVTAGLVAMPVSLSLMHELLSAVVLSVNGPANSEFRATRLWGGIVAGRWKLKVCR